MSEEKQEGEFSLKGKKTRPKNLGKQKNEPVKVLILLFRSFNV